MKHTFKTPRGFAFIPDLSTLNRIHKSPPASAKPPGLSWQPQFPEKKESIKYFS
jgi:hypothetical protein